MRRLTACDVLYRQLVDRIGKRIEQANGDRFYLFGQQNIDLRHDIGRVEGAFYMSLGIDALVHHAAQIALHKRRRFLPTDVVEARHAQRADFQYVAEALGGDEANLGPLVLENSVGSDGRTVANFFQRRRRYAAFAEHPAQTSDDGVRIIVDARRDLLRMHRAVAVHADTVVAFARHARLLRGSAQGLRVVPLHLRHLRPPPAAPYRRTQALRGGRIDRPRSRVDDDAIIGLRPGGGQELVAHVLQHRRSIALEWITPTAPTGVDVAEYVALVHLHRYLRRQRPIFAMRVQIVLGGVSGAAAVKAEGLVRLAVRAHREHRLDLVEAVAALEWHATAELAGSGLVGHELVGQHRDGLLGLDDLGRRARLVGEHVRVAVEAIGPGSRAPRAARELDVHEGLALLVVAANGNAAVAAVTCRLDFVGQHHGERAVHAVYHAEASEPARR